MKEKHKPHFRLLLTLVLVVLVILFLLLENIVVLHKVNKGLLIAFIVLAYLTSCYWVFFHHKIKYSNNNKNNKK